MPAAKKDKHAGELAKFVKAWESLGSPTGSGPEQTLRVLLARNGTRDGANKACDALWDRYIDINEFRIANPKEVGGLIGAFVKNDPEDVAHHLRGFLREYYKHRNTLDFGEWRDHTPEQMRKYLDGTEWFAQEIALTIFCQLLAEELEDEEVEEPEEGGEAPKPRKRTDREAALAMDRLRMACAFAAFGESPSKAKQSIGHRKLSEAFKYGPVPELPPPPEPPTIPQIVVPPAGGSKVALKVVKTPAKKKVASKPAKPTKPVAKKAAKKVAKKVAKKAAKKVAKKAAKKTAAKKKASKTTGGTRAAGAARPRTTRATRSPSKSKKSSRR